MAKEDGDLFCIYSNEEMSMENFSIDHFIPWSFVTHDQLWNLIPTSRSVNSSKGNNFPSLSEYLDPFVEIQHKAFKIFLENNQKHKNLLYDYTTIFKDDLNGIARLKPDEFGNVLKENINPLYQIGENMGFSTDWTL
ncbi:HNH endonuclease domain-containing protein [Cyclobacterium salsum]|uniref:HNH endonuclease domain-containing protein n=1 Tax=Cyclobacterium salsum TaxID=2666329 RepID=UPI001390F32A|nr:HNH endonuclease domain-containing protein [Cyclobacterium salsum]